VSNVNPDQASVGEAPRLAEQVTQQPAPEEHGASNTRVETNRVRSEPLLEGHPSIEQARASVDEPLVTQSTGLAATPEVPDWGKAPMAPSTVGASGVHADNASSDSDDEVEEIEGRP
jgi:hypothetical protein